MFQEFDLTLGKENIGKVIVERQGLYYKIVCRCVFRDPGVYRVHAAGSAGTVDLGICVPVDTGFGIMTRVSVRTLGTQICGFWVISSKNIKTNKVVRITEKEPFPYIGQLKNACLVRGEHDTHAYLKLEINSSD